MQTARSLTKAQLRDLEAELLAERKRLERSMSMTAAAVGDGAPDRDDTAISSDADGEFALRASVLARHEAIQAALRRLAAGEYGSCADCQQPIPYGRLLVMPESERCVACGPMA